VEYAGYSGDASKPSQRALMKNVEDARDFLLSQNPKATIVIGESLGSYFAAYHSYLTKPDKTLLITPFDSMGNVAQHHYWFLPTRYLLHDKYKSAQFIPDAENVLILHGVSDEIIPIEFSRNLFGLIKSDKKEFLEIPKTGHNDIYDSPTVIDKIIEFLK
jgi:hypothetical protein